MITKRWKATRSTAATRSNDHDWNTIPEPATIAMLATYIGLRTTRRRLPADHEARWVDRRERLRVPCGRTARRRCRAAASNQLRATAVRGIGPLRCRCPPPGRLSNHGATITSASAGSARAITARTSSTSTFNVVPSHVGPTRRHQSMNSSRCSTQPILSDDTERRRCNRRSAHLTGMSLAPTLWTHPGGRGRGTWATPRDYQARDMGRYPACPGATSTCYGPPVVWQRLPPSGRATRRRQWRRGSCPPALRDRRVRRRNTLRSA